MPGADKHIRDRTCVEHILRYCEQVCGSLAEIQHDRDRFLASHTYQNAISMCILQIGELLSVYLRIFCRNTSTFLGV